MTNFFDTTSKVFKGSLDYIQNGYKDNLEYNFRQDIEAVKIVFNSKVKMTILPCNNVVSNLRIDIDTITFVTKLDRNTIYKDLFMKLGE